MNNNQHCADTTVPLYEGVVWLQIQIFDRFLLKFLMIEMCAEELF